MSKQWQIRRGTTVENDSFTGAVGEITMDTDKNQIRLHDGTTQGGHIFGDTVVEWQVPTAENGYTWYRKYRSGWIEQGGVLSQTGGIQSVSFPVEMADTNYVLIRTQNQSSSAQSQYPGWTSGTESRTTTGFTYNALSTSVWQVSGMAA